MFALHALLQPVRSMLHFVFSTLNDLLGGFYGRVNSINRRPPGNDEHLSDFPEPKPIDVILDPTAGDTSGNPRSYPDEITYTCVSGAPQRARDVSHYPGHIQRPQPRYGEIIYITKGEILAWGGTAILERLPSGAVMKTPIPNPYCPLEEEDHRRNMRLEARIYARLGEHPRLPKLIHWDEETCCLSMEYLENGNLKEYILQNHQNITSQLRLKWSTQTAEALAFLHRSEVIHCDLSPRNFLLDSHLNVKIADFGGASLCGSDPSATPATRFRHPGYNWNTPPIFGDDLFSLGSLIYFIMTGSYPYEDVPSDQVEKLYETCEFPDVSSIFCGKIIMQCWRRQLDSAQAIYDYLTAVEGNVS